MAAQKTSYKPPRQARSQASLERYLDATEALIREKGFDDLTVVDVVSRAGTSIGGLYSRFPNKNSLLEAVMVRFHARVENSIRAAFGTAGEALETLEQTVGRVVDLLADHLLREPELFRAFILQAYYDPSVREGGESANKWRRDSVSQALLRHREEIAHSNPELAARWFYTVCMAVLRERLLLGEDSEITGVFSTNEATAELKRTLTSYLTSPRS